VAACLFPFRVFFFSDQDVSLARIIRPGLGKSSVAGSREMPMWGPILRQIKWDQNFRNVRRHNLAKDLESIQQK
jgi:hypothetical protein